MSEQEPETLLILDKDNFDQSIAQHSILFIDFWAPWCQPCINFETIYQEVATEHPDVAFAKINVDEQSELAKEFSIRSIPFLMVIKQRAVIYAESGTVPKTVLEELVEQAKQAVIES